MSAAPASAPRASTRRRPPPQAAVSASVTRAVVIGVSLACANAAAPPVSALAFSVFALVVSRSANALLTTSSVIELVAGLPGDGALRASPQSYANLVDGSPATSATWSSAQYTTYDAATGWLYIPAYTAIYRVSPAVGSVYRVVGGGDTTRTCGAPGDGGPATSANLVTYAGGALAPGGGYLYFVDACGSVTGGCHRSSIRVVNFATGVVSTFAPCTSGFDLPYVLVTDSAGNVYCANEWGNAVSCAGGQTR